MLYQLNISKACNDQANSEYSKNKKREENWVRKHNFKLVHSLKIQIFQSQTMVVEGCDTSETWNSMDGHPTLVFKPVYKSFKFKTASEAMKGQEIEKNASLEDNSVFISNPKDGETDHHNPRQDEHWKAGMDYDLPELVAFLQDNGYQFVKDIREVPSQNECLEQDLDLDHSHSSCIISSDAETNSESFVETQDSSVSSNSTESKYISEHLCKDVSKLSGLENLTIEDDSSSDHSTKKTISETLLLVKQDTARTALSTEEINDYSHPSEASLKFALENARRREVFPLRAHCHSLDSSEDEMSYSLTGSTQSQQHCGTTARCEEILPQSDSSEDWMSNSMTGSSHSQQDRRENARRKLLGLSLECHPRISSVDEMSDIPIETSPIQHHLRGDSSSSVSDPLAMYSGATPNFGSFSLGSNSSTNSSRSFTFPILSAEWIGSPVRMVEADRTQLPRPRRWGIRLLCCYF